MLVDDIPDNVARHHRGCGSKQAAHEKECRGSRGTAHGQQDGKERPQKTLRKIKVLRVAKKSDNGNRHDGAGTAQPIRSMVGAEHRANLSDVITHDFHGVGGREMVWISRLVKYRIQLNFDATTRFLSVSWAYFCQVEEASPIAKGEKVGGHEPFGAYVTIVEVDDELEELAP